MLQDAGYGEKSLFAPPDDDDNEDDARKIDDEVSATFQQPFQGRDYSIHS